MISNKVIKKIGIAISVMALFGMTGCAEKETPAASASTKPVPVSAAAAEQKTISSAITITGKVKPISEVTIIPKIPGKVLAVPVDVGSTVKKGDLLVRLDTEELELSLTAARNGLQNAQLAHRQAQLNYDNAKTNFERMKSLYDAGAIAKIQLEQAELQYNLAKTAVDQPVVESAQNQIDIINNQIANATITSPMAGEITLRQADPGEMAGTSQPVMAVVDVDKVFIEADVAEKEVGLVSGGQQVTVEVGAAGQTVTGLIKTVSPAANPQTKGYLIRVEVSNEKHLLKPGMFASIRIVTMEKKEALVIPQNALVAKGDKQIVYVIKDGKIQERKVETGLRADGLVEIIAGLDLAEKFVIYGQSAVTDGAEVTIIE